MNEQQCQISGLQQQNTLKIIISGDWCWDSKLPNTQELLQVIATNNTLQRIEFDTTNLGLWCSLLMVELLKLINCANSRQLIVDQTTLPKSIQGLLTLAHSVPERSDTQRDNKRLNLWEKIDRDIQHAHQHLQDIMRFVGETVLSITAVMRGQAHFRPADFWLYLQECGPAALPIISMISLLVGLILAFVGALELSLFGAEIYIANLVSLGMTREMGGLMTAVIMSGRTGAAYAAQLGTMHVNNEIDALKTMNLEPIAFLVLPRMLALIIIMPLLCLYSDLMGIIGGGLVSVSLFDVSLLEYLHRSSHAVHLMDFMVGFFKCSVFGVLIALSGCMRGMQCGSSASAVGEAATSAVVTCIVFIVLADSIITIICNRIGI